MYGNYKFRILASIVLTCIALATSPLFAYEISSSAIVNEDGTLRIKGKTIHLYGIHIPRTDRTCRSNQLPTVCGSRAAVALDFKIDGFVRCEIFDELDDGSIVGRCRVNASRFDDGEDLSAYLLENGWAVALPDAPFEYQTLEKIAQSRQFGVWGIPVDRVVENPLKH
jgi:endonuclease YncB( thermonuclease family)